MRLKGLDLNLLVVLDALLSERGLTAAARRIKMRRNKEGLQGGSIEMSCSGTNSVRCWRKRSTGGRRSTSIAPPSGAMRTDSPRRRALIDRSKLNRVILSADIIHELLTMLQRAPGFYEFSCSEGPGGAVEAHPGHLGLI